LIRYFSLEHVTQSAGIFDDDKLKWLNAQYIKMLPPPEAARLLTPFLAPLGIKDPDAAYLAKAAATLQARSQTLQEMAPQARFYFLDPRPYEEKAAQKFLTPETAPVLTEIASRLRALPEWSEAGLTQMLQELSAQRGLKMVNLAQPVRVALTGKTASPGLTEIMAILGKDEVLRRIANALSFIHQE
jgi:glutamyl-tRNA synthetase